MEVTTRTLILINGAAMVKAVQCVAVVHKDVSSVVISMVAAVDHVVVAVHVTMAVHAMMVANVWMAMVDKAVAHPIVSIVHVVQATENPTTAEDQTTNNNRMLARRYKIPLLKAVLSSTQLHWKRKSNGNECATRVNGLQQV